MPIETGGMGKIIIGCSSCLLSNKVRYDGRDALDAYIAETLALHFHYLPLCPEIEYGLPVPREPMILRKKGDRPRLLTVETGIDHTEGMLKWAAGKAAELKSAGLCGFIFKSRSPSCGLGDAKVYDGTRMIHAAGTGIFARFFLETFPHIPVIGDERLHDSAARELFLSEAKKVAGVTACKHDFSYLIAGVIILSVG